MSIVQENQDYLGQNIPKYYKINILGIQIKLYDKFNVNSKSVL